MATYYNCEKFKEHINSNIFGVCRTPCHPSLHSYRPALFHNSGPTLQQQLQIFLRQPHYRNIKQLLPHIYYSPLSSSDYSGFSISGAIFLWWCDYLRVFD